MKEIIYREVEKLVLLEDNPRKISDEQMERLKESIDKNPDYFECRPVILSDRTGELVVIAGNQRVKAATDIGLKAVPTILLSGLTEEREKEIIIRDNVNNGEWDEELLTEWDAALLDDWGVDISALSEKDFLQTGEENREAIDDNYKIPKNAPSISKEGDIFKLGEHRLICGDSTDAGVIADLMAGEMADLIVTDPPYNVAYEGGTKDKLTIDNDNMSSSQFFEFLYKAFQAASNALKSGGAFYVWFAEKEHINFENALSHAGLIVKQTLIWNKNAFVLGRQDYHWKHEPCLYGWKEGAGHYFIKRRDLHTVIDEGGMIDIESMTEKEAKDMLIQIINSGDPVSVMDENKPPRNGEYPTMKPLPLMGRLVRNSSRQGEIVLDMFGGSGSTMMACEQLGRKCYMVEYSPKYCDVIIDRWEKLTGKKAEKVS